MTESPSRWPIARIIAWGITAIVVVVVVGPTYVRAFLPPDGAYTDFLQEWLSARNYLTGAPVYREVPVSLQEHMPHRQRPDGSWPNIAFTDPASGAVIAEMKYNAHPPFAVLLAVPFAVLDYPYAHLAWNLLTYGLFLAAIAVVVNELKVPFAWPALFPAIILLLGNPVLNQLYQGQLNCLLASLITAAWVADRRGRSALGGVAIGLAGAVKLYPLFLLIYFTFTRRWNGLAAGILAFLAANGFTGTVFGMVAFHEYFLTVVPAVAGQFEKSWVNLSLHGFWLRLMEAEQFSSRLDSTTVCTVGRGLAWSGVLAMTLLVARACHRARTREKRDCAFALAMVATLLVSPITWSHYSLLLLLPLVLAWMQASPGSERWVFGAILGLLWLPPNFAAQVWRGQDGAALLNDLNHSRLTIRENLGIVSIPHYALVGLFLLVLRQSGRAGIVPAHQEHADCCRSPLNVVNHVE
jgi:hypothetical protein